MALLRSTLASLMLCAVVALSAGSAGAHGVMREPESRAVGQPEEDYQYCFGTPGCECGDFPEAGPIMAIYEAGQVVRVTLEITQSHVSSPTFRFQLCPPDELSPNCFVDGEFATFESVPSVGPHSYDIQLPDGVVCDPCVLRWKWDYGFLSCADVRIVEKVPAKTLPWAALKARYR